ncbi:MAG: DnaJ C-terminal domain-containing protein [Gammaproteobacteria bacterium]|jgi:curved DNA-binding protein
MEYKDYYKILGVSRDAPQDEIKKVYRRLARKYHPDVSKEADAEDRFKEVNEAYEVLKDPEKRKAYDQLGANWKAGQEFRPPPGWEQGFDFGGAGGGFEGFAGGSGFSDFFESLFGGGFGRAAGGHGGFRAKGQDVITGIDIDLEEAFHGSQKSLRLSTGKTLQVRIPAGVTTGQRIRLSGQGGPGMGGGPNGDLYLEVHIRPHALYLLDGRDISLNLPVTPWEAALGTSLEVPTLSGRVNIKIPAGTQSGRKLRLKGRGLPGHPAGDMYLVIHISTPPADSAAARDFYERMRKEIPFNPRAHLS